MSSEYNLRGVPKAPFIEDISQFIKSQQETPDALLCKFREMFSKYRFMESHTLQREQALREKVPEITKSIEILRYLQSTQDSNEDTTLSFELNDTLYCNARIPNEASKSAYIWLGANVMVEYPVDEAIEMLSTKIENCNSAIARLEQERMFLREQITTIEVSIARLYNWTIKNKP